MTNNNETTNCETEPMTMNILVMSPGGNTTVMVEGIIDDAIMRKRINSSALTQWPEAEQVCMFDSNTQSAMMTGKEPCVNAFRAFAYILLQGKPGQTRIRDLGVSNREYRAGVDEANQAWVEIPLANTNLSINQGFFVVNLSGITQVVVSKPEGITTQEEYRQTALDILNRLELLNLPAAGVMFLDQTPQGTFIYPVVRVKDDDTLFFETACGSGSIAAAQAITVFSQQELDNYPLIQPSGSTLLVSIRTDEAGNQYAKVAGPVTTVNAGTSLTVI